jgi:tyramine---L-glutamate ligase
MRVFFGEYLSGLVDEPLDDGLLAQGVGMRDAVLADLRACAAQDAGLQISYAVSKQAPLPESLAGVRQLRPVRGESAFDFVRRQALVHDVVWLIAPETDDILGHLSEAVPASRWLGCDSASIRVASSKARTTRLLHDQGVLTPLAFDKDASVQAWVVKPDDGVGASEARRHASRAAAEADLAQRPAAVLEPWVTGPAMSLSLLCEGGRAELLSVNRQAIAVDAQGWLIEQGAEPVGPDAEPALHRLAQHVVHAMPGLFGLVGIDYVAHAERGPVLIEVNPRVTSVYAGLAQRLPRSLARAVLDLMVRSRLPCAC